MKMAGLRFFALAGRVEQLLACCLIAPFPAMDNREVLFQEEHSLNGARPRNSSSLPFSAVFASWKNSVSEVTSIFLSPFGRD